MLLAGGGILLAGGDAAAASQTGVFIEKPGHEHGLLILAGPVDLGRSGGDLPRRLRPHVRIATRGREGGAAAPVPRSSPARGEGASGNGTRGAATRSAQQPVEGNGTATARGLLGKGARHQPATPPAVPWPETEHRTGGGTLSRRHHDVMTAYLARTRGGYI